MRPEWVLVLVTCVWGGTFLAVQTALTWSGPLFFVGMRFGCAALVLGGMSWFLGGTAVSGRIGSGDIGSGDIGAGNTGAGDTGSGDTGSGDTVRAADGVKAGDGADAMDGATSSGRASSFDGALSIDRASSSDGVTFGAVRGWSRIEVIAGISIGVAIAIGYGLQTIGLQTIPSSKSAFITALYVPLVPLLQWGVWGRAPIWTAWIGIILATIGLFLIAGPEAGGIRFSLGEVVTMVSTLAIAGEVVLISVFAGRVAAYRVTMLQLAVASVLCFACVPVMGEPLPADLGPVFGFALGLGVASAAIQLAMNWAQRVVSPTRATLIYSGEPVWAGIIGRFAGERLPVLALIGGGLVIAGMVFGEWPARRKRR